MSDRVFLDTNILVYAHTDVDVAKQSIAQKLIIDNLSFISTQVLQELANTLNRKFNHSWKDVAKVLADATENNSLHINTDVTIKSSCRLAGIYKFSFYDSLIIAAALECDMLYSEDLNNGQIIEKKLTIVNPFIPV